MKFISKVLVLALSVFLLIGVKSAEAGSFKLNKSRIVFEQDDRREELKIYNESDELQSFRIMLTEMQMNDEGNLEPVNEYKYSAKDYLKVGPRIARDIPPKSYARIKLIKKRISTEGEFRSHLLVESLKTDIAKQVSGVFIQPNIKYVIPVFVRNYPPEQKATVVLEKHFIDEKTNTLSFTFKRTGVGSFSGNFVINSAEGDELFRTNQVSIYPELERRTFTTDLKKETISFPLTVMFESLGKGEAPQFKTII